MEMVLAAARRMGAEITAMVVMMAMQAENRGVMQRRSKVQKENQVSQEKPGCEFAAYHLGSEQRMFWRPDSDSIADDSI